MASDKALVEIFAADKDAGLPIVIGVPFEQGAVKDPASLAVTGPGGDRLPAAGRTLSAWPDGSVRWGLLTFAATEKGPHTVGAGAGAGPEAANRVRLHRQGDKVLIDNSLVQVVLGATGPGPVHGVKAFGHAYLESPESLRFLVDSADTTHEKARTITVLEESPLRVRVRVEGGHFDAGGTRLLNYRLDVELWANWPTLRLDYHFMNLEKGREEIDIRQMAMECELALGPRTQRHVVQSVHGLSYVPREVFNPAPVVLVADETRGPAHVEDPAMLLDEVKYPLHLRPPLIDTSEWLGVGDGTRSVYVQMQDFCAMRPKRLGSQGTYLRLDFWPRNEGTLTLFQGRSRRQVVTFAFSDQPRLDPARAAQLLSAPLTEGRAAVDPAWLRRRGEFDMDRTMAVGANVRFEKFLRRLVTLGTPQDWFDLGDTIDSGYCRTYLALGLDAQPLKHGAPDMPRVFLATGHSPFAEWAIPERFEPVWTNNEYDGIHALCTQIMRTGTPDYWTQARWFVRHNIEVDFVHYHDDLQQNRATPQHSYKHNRTGSIPSHFWTQGLLEYYCMTGDADVLEIATALGDKIIEDLTVPALRKSFWGFTRELGWPCLALAHLWDITRLDRHHRQLKEIVDFFLGYDRRKFHGPINLSGANARYTLERQMVGSFFGYACMFEGVDHYQRRSGRADVKAWLVQLVEELRQGMEAAHAEGQQLHMANMHPLAMAIGYEQTGEKRFLQTGMRVLDEVVDTPWWTAPPNETKPVAMSYRGIVRFLHHAHAAGMLATLEYPAR